MQATMGLRTDMEPLGVDDAEMNAQVAAIEEEFSDQNMDNFVEEREGVAAYDQYGDNVASLHTQYVADEPFEQQQPVCHKCKKRCHDTSAYDKETQWTPMLMVFAVTWCALGVLSYVAALWCLTDTGTFEQKILGLLLALGFGPFYFVYVLSSSSYCPQLAKAVRRVVQRH